MYDAPDLTKHACLSCEARVTGKNPRRMMAKHVTFTQVGPKRIEATISPWLRLQKVEIRETESLSAGHAAMCRSLFELVMKSRSHMQVM